MNFIDKILVVLAIIIFSIIIFYILYFYSNEDILNSFVIIVGISGFLLGIFEFFRRK